MNPLEQLDKIEAQIKALDKAVGLKPETMNEINEKIAALREKYITKVHISFVKVDFKCPYCEREYNDSEDKYLDRCNRNRSGTTRIVCSCGKRFGMTYDITGQAIGFDLNPNNV